MQDRGAKAEDRAWLCAVYDRGGRSYSRPDIALGQDLVRRRARRSDHRDRSRRGSVYEPLQRLDRGPRLARAHGRSTGYEPTPHDAWCSAASTSTRGPQAVAGLFAGRPRAQPPQPWRRRGRPVAHLVEQTARDRVPAGRLLPVENAVAFAADSTCRASGVRKQVERSRYRAHWPRLGRCRAVSTQRNDFRSSRGFGLPFSSGVGGSGASNAARRTPNATPSGSTGVTCSQAAGRRAGDSSRCPQPPRPAEVQVGCRPGCTTVSVRIRRSVRSRWGARMFGATRRAISR